MTVPEGAQRPPSALSPLRNRVFRGIWTANMLSNVGGWMQTAGAAWEMTSLTSQPIFVALLAAAGTLPIFLFCFFAGILADRFDRRLYIIFCQCWMLVVSGIMAVLALATDLSDMRERLGRMVIGNSKAGWLEGVGGYLPA